MRLQLAFPHDIGGGTDQRKKHNFYPPLFQQSNTHTVWPTKASNDILNKRRPSPSHSVTP